MTTLFAVSGAHSSGKTTTIRDVKAICDWIGFRLAVGEEAARGCPHPLNEESNYEAQDWFLRRHLEIEERVRREPVSAGLVDRCRFDQAAYAMWLADHGRMTMLQAEDLRRRSLQGPPYETVFLLDPLPVAPDPLRSPNPEYQAGIYSRIHFLLHEHLSFGSLIHLGERGRLDRAARIVQHLQSRLRWYVGFGKTAVFFDVDGTLEGWGGPVNPLHHRRNGSFMGYVSVRDDGETVHRETGLTTLPVPYSEKSSALRCIRHCLRWISPLDFVYVGDKASDRDVALGSGWKYLTPDEYLRRVNRNP